MTKVRYKGIDAFNRPVFEDDKGNFFGSCDVLFSIGVSKEVVAKKIKSEDLVYFGSRWQCEPMGTKATVEIDWEIGKKTEQVKIIHDMIRNPRRNKITLKKDPVADTRSCDPTKVTMDELGTASARHVLEVDAALGFLAKEMRTRTTEKYHHDHDKLSDLAGFHRDFSQANEKAFTDGEWYKNHLKANRHHLNHPDGIPEDVNMIDVMEHIADVCVACMARTGEMKYPIALSDELLQKAVTNTVKLLLDHIEVTP